MRPWIWSRPRSSWHGRVPARSLSVTPVRRNIDSLVRDPSKCSPSSRSSSACSPCSRGRAASVCADVRASCEKRLQRPTACCRSPALLTVVFASSTEVNSQLDAGRDEGPRPIHTTVLRQRSSSSQLDRRHGGAPVVVLLAPVGRRHTQPRSARVQSSASFAGDIMEFRGAGGPSSVGLYAMLRADCGRCWKV